MASVSIIIIAKNEIENIAGCVISAQLVSDDIIVIDSGSTDNTQAIAKLNGARVLDIQWNGFGDARNKGVEIARYNWILAVDADERITDRLANAINQLHLDTTNIVFGFKRRSFWEKKMIRFGEWGRDVVYRLYNKEYVHWNNNPVHEHLETGNVKKEMIDGIMLHYTMKNFRECKEKIIRYAGLSAAKYAQQKKKGGVIKEYFSPVFSFIQNYFFRLGFLDGKEGIIIAWSTAYYTWLKYYNLKQLYKKTAIK